MPKITVEEFKSRLVALCSGSGKRAFPRKENEKLILYKSLFMSMETERDYSEKELRVAFETWLMGVGSSMEMDHVTLRRDLVDEHFITRDPAGTVYKLNSDRLSDLFDPEVDRLDPMVIIEEARAEKERKRQEFMKKAGG